MSYLCSRIGLRAVVRPKAVNICTFIMIKLTFPDGSVREYESGITPLQVAESISTRLAQDILVASVKTESQPSDNPDEGWQITELNAPLTEDCQIKLHKWDDPEAKHAFWHTSSHLMAEALQELYPGIQFGFGSDM